MSGAVPRSKVPTTVLDGDCGQGPRLQSRKGCCGQCRVQPCTAQPLPRDLGGLSLFLPAPRAPSSTFSWGTPTLEPPSISLDTSYSLVSLTMGSPGRAPQYP